MIFQKGGVCDRIRIRLCVCSGALPSNYLCDLYAHPGTPHVHPGTAAVNQTACNFPIKGRAFAIALHSKPEKPTVNISNRNYKISKTVCSILDPRKALTFHYKF